MVQFTLLMMAFCTSSSPPTRPWIHPVDRLQYKPTITQPTGFDALGTSSNGAGKLYTVSLPAAHEYGLAPPLLIDVGGNSSEVGEAYGELLGTRIEIVFSEWISHKIPPGKAGDGLLDTVDWLWRCSLAPNTPTAFMEEIEGIGVGGKKVGADNLTSIVTRLTTMASLPADSQNIAALIKGEVARHAHSKNGCAAPPAAIATTLAMLPSWKHRPGAGFCDFYAAWGSMTEGGRLLSSRNLDFDFDTGIAKSKLVTIYRIDGQSPYVTFGNAGVMGALAGMSRDGMTVSEANLDNGEVSFNGLAWPLRLRHVLGHTASLAEARSLWIETENSAAFNFLLGSASDAAVGPAAVALEAVGDFTAEFTGGPSSIEDTATFTCINGTVMDGVACHWPGNPEPVVIGSSLKDAVFRTNHALHPNVMRTQEPVWNDTVMRYYMMHDRLVEAAAMDSSKLTAERAVNITALLGQKGGDYGSCDPSNQKTGDPSNIMSIVYDPSLHQAYAAWEDHPPSPGVYMPAACNPYIRFNFTSLFDGLGPTV